MASPLLERTTYDRSCIRAGIVHIGVGAFHRAHQAVYLDKFLEISASSQWGIVGVNLRAESRGLADQV